MKQQYFVTDNKKLVTELKVWKIITNLMNCCFMWSIGWI